MEKWKFHILNSSGIQLRYYYMLSIQLVMHNLMSMTWNQSDLPEDAGSALTYKQLGSIPTVHVQILCQPHTKHALLRNQMWCILQTIGLCTGTETCRAYQMHFLQLCKVLMGKKEAGQIKILTLASFFFNVENHCLKWGSARSKQIAQFAQAFCSPAWGLVTVPRYVLEQAPLDVPVIVSWLLGPTVLERAIVSSDFTSM